MPTFGWIKNPLSIIAIFISLIYGISGLLFTFSVSRLTMENQTVLVWFTVLFPVAVLGVFAWLVAKHHHKLYGPGDYRGDEPFTRTFPTATPNEVAHKIEKEIEYQKAESEIVKELRDAHSDATAAPNVMLDAEGYAEIFRGLEPSAETTAFVLEGLAIQELQREFKGPVIRDVKIRDGLIIDALIENNEEMVLAEVKVIVGKASWFAFTTFQAAARVLTSAQDALIKENVRKPIVRLIAVVIADNLSQSNITIALERIKAEQSSPLWARVFKASELLKTFPRPAQLEDKPH
jgi:hypothetical protein